MRHVLQVTLLASLLSAGCSSAGTDDSVAAGGQDLLQHSQVSEWLTTRGDIEHPFQKQASIALGNDVPAAGSLGVITVDDTQLKQSVEGFGAALTDASAHILRYELGPGARHALLDELMSPAGLGLNMIRLPIAASDSTANGEYSYDDNGPDPSLRGFSVRHDDAYILPMLRRIVKDVNPDVRVIATPWSPPGWMKENHYKMIGGSLRPEYRQTYAEYLVKFVRAYWEYGVPIYAITPQNEPGQPANYPSMTLSAQDEADLITRHIRPSLNRAHFGWVKIFGFDHNWGDSYPDELMGHLAHERSGDAVGDIAGMAFHCYGGDQSHALTEFHRSHPNMDIFMTECDRGETPSHELHGGAEGIQKLIRSMNNWSRSYMAWQLVLHPDGTPNQGNGCRAGDNSWHCVGVVSVERGRVTKEHDYAYLGHASKFVARGARVATLDHTALGPIESVAFVNPDGKRVFLAYNASSSEQASFQVKWHDSTFNASLAPGAVATYAW